MWERIEEWCEGKTKSRMEKSKTFDMKSSLLVVFWWETSNVYGLSNGLSIKIQSERPVLQHRGRVHIEPNEWEDLFCILFCESFIQLVDK